MRSRRLRFFAVSVRGGTRYFAAKRLLFAAAFATTTNPVLDHWGRATVLQKQDTG